MLSPKQKLNAPYRHIKLKHFLPSYLMGVICFTANVCTTNSSYNLYLYYFINAALLTLIVIQMALLYLTVNLRTWKIFAFCQSIFLLALVESCFALRNQMSWMLAASSYFVLEYQRVLAKQFLLKKN